MTAAIPLRVTVLDTWETAALEFPPEASIAAVKHRALQGARVTRPLTSYLVKYLGAEVRDESVTLADLGVAPHGGMIVMPRARIPAR